MTHDEVIAWIDDKLAILTEIENTTLVMPMEVIARASLLANRDVLERHHYDINFVDGVSEVCGEDYDPFPCDTRKDIAQRLDEVM